jgi:hypothetical protein
MAEAMATLQCMNQLQIDILVQNHNPKVVQACSAGNQQLAVIVQHLHVEVTTRGHVCRDDSGGQILIALIRFPHCDLRT